MSESDARLEADRLEGAPHPRETLRLFGQDKAEAAFLDAFRTGRLHHAWLLTGPRGVGKATLAWRMARFLLATPDPGAEGGLFGAPETPATLDVAPDHPVARRIAAGAEPGLFVLRRGLTERGDRLAAEIRVDEVRRLRDFFGLSAADGGRRVVIVDAADELNIAAANALLKVLEEPPERAILLLVSHQPSRLLPTIRSRCRVLRLDPLHPQALEQALAQAGAVESLSPEDTDTLAALAGGSVGMAIRLAGGGGLEISRELLAHISAMPAFNRPRTIAFAESLAQRGSEARLDLAIDLIEILLARLARTGATGAPPRPPLGPEEGEALLRLSPSAAAGRAWAELAQTLGVRLRHGRLVNLDPAALMLDTLIRISETARRLAAPQGASA